MTYNMTSVWDANTPMSIISAINEATKGWFISGLLFILYVGILIIFSKENIRATMMLDGLVIFIIASLLYALKWIPFNTLIIPILLLFIGLMAYIFME